MEDNSTIRGLDSFRKRWHRLYLDTAELNDIGRARVDQALLRDLSTACEAHAVILVVSIEHMRDAMKPGDKDAPGRLADAIEQFPLRGLVDIGPDAIEPWRDGPSDIKIDPWANVREVLLSPAAQPALAEQAKLQDASYAGDVAANASMRVTRDIKTPKRLQSLVVGTTVTLMRGWMGDDVAAIVDMHAAREEVELNADERAALIASVQPVVEMVRHIGPVMDQQSVDRTEALRRVGLGPDRAPGFWLAGKLVANRMRNVTRDPSRSDSIDVFHTAYFPYVDIATCDRQTYDAISGFVGQARGSRTASLFRNGQLPAILAQVQKLPTGEELTRRFAEAP